MKNIYSKINNELLCSYIRKEDISEYRTDLSPVSEFMQVSAIKMNKNTKVQSHKHIYLEKPCKITQESWVVLQGSIKCKIFDTDDSFVQEITLNSGDSIVLFRGGHGLEVLVDDTLFYEFKNGPYLGLEKDKEKIYE